MNQTVLQKKRGFAIFPSVKVMEFKTDSKGKTTFSWASHLIFGDFIKLLTGPDGLPEFMQHNNKEYVKVRGRNRNGWVLPHEIQPNRILEVNFVDVGQGDGCHLVTPQDEHYIIDAGASDNMLRFLKWRFNLKQAANFPPPMNVVISHSDSDHYAGFAKIFDHQRNGKKTFTINAVYHNGMVEKSGKKPDTLGTLVKHAGVDYITNLCLTNADFQARVSPPSGHGIYIKTLLKTTAPKIGLHSALPPLGGNGTSLQILGPVKQDILGKPALEVFDDKGKTKNGHSVILKLAIGKVKLLLGGDLNGLSEDYLFRQYTGANMPQLRDDLKSHIPATKTAAAAAIKAAVQTARGIFQTDIAKSCHHGASDFTSEFMDALNPIATVVSSGDEEPHGHPRPDTLGTIGKYSRGERPLIFSTEMARSTPEFLKLIQNQTPGTPLHDKERVVTRYGMINVRTDGEKIIIAQKLEQRAARGDWDIHELLWNQNLLEFEYQL